MAALPNKELASNQLTINQNSSAESIKSLGLTLLLKNSSSQLSDLKKTQDALANLNPSNLALARIQRANILSEQQHILRQAEVLKELLCIPFVEQYRTEQELEYLRYRYRHLQLELESLPQLITLKELADTDYILGHTALCLLLANLADSVLVSSKFSGSQIDEVASQILALKSLTLEDIMRCIYNAKSGHYGDIYRLDGMVVMKWINEYKAEQHKALVEHNNSLHRQYASPNRRGERDGEALALHRLKVEQVTKQLLPPKKPKAKKDTKPKE